MKSKYKVFWDWFTENEKYINEELENKPNEIAFLVYEELTKVHPELHFEIPFELKNNSREFIISADGVIEMFPVVEELFKNAPDYADWVVTCFRPRTYQRDQVTEMDGVMLSYEDIFYTESITGNKLDLDIYIKGYDGEDNRYIHAYFILLDTLIGEYDAVTKINHTKVHPFVEGNDYQPIKNIIKLIDELSVK